MKMSEGKWRARAEAYEEAAEHLGMSWTDDSMELEQGQVAAAEIRKLAARCRRTAESYGTQFLSAK